MRRDAAARQERGQDLAFRAASLDAKQAFSNVTPTILRKTMRDFNMNASLASVLLHEQIGGKNEVNVQETRKSNIPHGRSIKQGGKESPYLVMKKMVRTLHQRWKKRKKWRF